MVKWYCIEPMLDTAVAGQSQAMNSLITIYVGVLNRLKEGHRQQQQPAASRHGDVYMSRTSDVQNPARSALRLMTSSMMTRNVLSGVRYCTYPGVAIVSATRCITNAVASCDCGVLYCMDTTYRTFVEGTLMEGFATAR